MSSVDVIVPCYRYGRYLRDCVMSVLTQASVPVRVLVLDDCSPDETPEVGQALAEEDARVTYRRHAQNLGHIATYNQGIAWASADYALLLSADDYLMPGALGRAASLLDSHPTMSFCFGDATVLREDGIPVRIYGPPELVSGASASHLLAAMEFVELCIRHNARNLVPTPTAVVRTELLKRLGGYRSELPHSADLELWLRLSAHGPVGYLGSNQAVYRRHAQNMSKNFSDDNVLRDLQQRLAAFDAFLLACNRVLADPPRLRARLLRALACDAVGLASTAFNHDRPEPSARLTDFARTVDPSVCRTGDWYRLALKRRIGFRLSSALLPAIAAVRRRYSRSGGLPREVEGIGEEW